MRAIGRGALLAGAAGAAMLGASPAWAQSGPANTAAQASEQDGGDILVLSARLEESTPEELEKYGSRLEVVDGEEIDQAGFVDAGQALQFLAPGVFLTPKSGAFDYVQVSLQGSRTSEVLFLTDGVRINNRLYGSTSPLDSIPSNMIERIEVLKGGQGLYYGTQAVGGIVNVITRGFTREFGGAIEASVDTNEGYHLNGYARGSAGDHYFVGFASHDETDGFQAFRDEDLQPSALDRNRGYKVTTLGGKYAFEPSDAFRFSASYQHNDAVVDFIKAEDNYRNHNDRDEDIVSVKLDWSPSEAFDLYVKGYYHDWDTVYLDLRPRVNSDGSIGETFTVFDGEMWGFDDLGVNVLGEYRINDNVALVGGYDFQTYRGYDDVFFVETKREQVHAPFAQVKFDSGNFSLAAGLRHNMPSDGQKKTVWNVSGRFGADTGIYARGQVGTAFRLPSASELYQDSVANGCCEQGNPNLVAEQSFNVEGGLGFTNNTINAEFIGFYREVDDLITIDFSLPAWPEGLFVNSDGQVKVWGGEAIVTARLSDVFSGTVDYTHTEAEMVGTTVQLVNIPRDQAKVILNADAPGGRFGANLALNWVGDLWANVAAIGRVNYGNYTVVNLGAYAFADEDHRHRLSLSLENALDADYDTAVTRVRTDVTNISYAAGFRGTPITLHVGYRLGF
ncbi:MAG TPA: TonB-dependent receptor [Croceibacterium sp.]